MLNALYGLIGSYLSSIIRQPVRLLPQHGKSLSLPIQALMETQRSLSLTCPSPGSVRRLHVNLGGGTFKPDRSGQIDGSIRFDRFQDIFT
jgi:hypothetical protein